MPIHVPLLFHFNRNLTEESLTATKASYKGLLRVLRAHPSIPVNIHISGALVNALQWLDPEPLQLIWEGLRAGQFELLGSTYAQNLTYSSDDWDNARQIEMHLKVLHDAFGVTPVTFWNPQRTWRQDLLPIIAGNGYRFTLIEDHILAQARLAEPVVVTSQVGAHILTLLYDDHLLRHLFNFAVWFGRPRQLQTYLARRAEHPNVNSHCLTYAEDAGAMGLWGWKKDVVPNQTWHRLDQILTLIEALPEVELIHLTNAPASAGNLSPIPDGNAMWMDRVLEDKGNSDEELDYEDWFDFNANSETLNRFRIFFGEIRSDLKRFDERLQEEKKTSKVRAARALYEMALENYLGHQYEFGCVGMGHDSYWGWKGARASLPILRAAELALAPETMVSEENLTGSDQDEVLLSDGRNLIITTPAGGRVLYWFDLVDGKQYVGNQRAVGLSAYKGDAALPERATLTQNRRLPDDYRPQPLVADARLTAEAAPTRMGDYLPDWVWEGERGPFELLIREPISEEVRRSIPVQRRAFTDYIQVDGADPVDAGAWLRTFVNETEVSYERDLSADLTLKKTYRLQDNELVVEYAWLNQGDAAASVEWCTLSELTPDYASILVKGRKTLQFIEDEERPGVRNPDSGDEVRLIGDAAPDSVHYHEGLLALEAVLQYDLEIGAGGERIITVRAQRVNTKQRERVSARER